MWRENTYPGCACDVRVHLYSFSFFPNPDWSHAYARQPEILAYLEKVASTFGLLPHLRLGHRVVETRWNESAARWEVRCENGAVFSARFVIAGLGGLSRPALPDLPGLSTFKGPVFHSARWDSTRAELSKARVRRRRQRDSVRAPPRRAIAEGQPVSAHAAVDHAEARQADRARTARAPEGRAPRAAALPVGPVLAARAPSAGVREGHLAHEGGPPRSAQAPREPGRRPGAARELTPDYTLGCKRVLVSDDFYPAVAKPNCEVVTTPIDTIVESGVKMRDGQVHPVRRTGVRHGFQVTDVVGPLSVIGRNGASLADVWSQGAKAWYGLAIHGFPNFFMLTGPNTGLGHSSMVFMIESQLAFVMKTIDIVLNTGARWWQVRDDAEASFHAAVQRRLQKTVWLSGCRSWYLDERGGHVARLHLHLPRGPLALRQTPASPRGSASMKAGQVAVITGAGSGIGRALAQLLDSRGCELVLADVNASGLDETQASLKGRRRSRRLDARSGSRSRRSRPRWSSSTGTSISSSTTPASPFTTRWSTSNGKTSSG